MFHVWFWMLPLREEFRCSQVLRMGLEVDGVLRVKFGWTDVELAELGETFWSLAELVMVRQQVIICRDPKDHHLLDTCAAAGAELLVTGDKDLLVFGSFEGYGIVTPRGLMTRLSSHDELEGERK